MTNHPSLYVFIAKTAGLKTLKEGPLVLTADEADAMYLQLSKMKDFLVVRMYRVGAEQVEPWDEVAHAKEETKTSA